MRCTKVDAAKATRTSNLPTRTDSFLLNSFDFWIASAQPSPTTYPAQPSLLPAFFVVAIAIGIDHNSISIQIVLAEDLRTSALHIIIDHLWLAAPASSK